jgi:hypothetical protein
VALRPPPRSARQRQEAGREYRGPAAMPSCGPLTRTLCSGMRQWRRKDAGLRRSMIVRLRMPITEDEPPDGDTPPRQTRKGRACYLRDRSGCSRTQATTEGAPVATQDNWEDSSGDSRSEGGAEAILTVLRARGIAVPDEAGQRIQSQRDSATLERWLERAVVATSIEDVLDAPS